MARAGVPPKVDSLDEQISSLLESVAVELPQADDPEPEPRAEEAKEAETQGLAAAHPGPRPKPEATTPARARGAVHNGTNEAPARRTPRHAAKPAPPKRTSPRAEIRRRPVVGRRPVETRPGRHRTRVRRLLVGDPEAREPAYFMIAGVLFGVMIGVLIALSA